MQARHPEVSVADLWVLAGTVAIEALGGPKVPMAFGRTDAASGAACPAIGRLPDASQGAQHLRDVFYRMGFDDREIVALSGAHTLGSCHRSRSGYEGPWTHNPLRFDNTFFRHILNQEWVPRAWDGPLQYQDKATGRLMMLPTDLALRDDPKFRVWTEKYAADEALFFRDFSAAFAKLLALGCPAACDPRRAGGAPLSAAESAAADLREAAMHGQLDKVQALTAAGADAAGLEPGTRRSALHKAAFWGHKDVIALLLAGKARTIVNVADCEGDTAMHDAARFGHTDIVAALLRAGGDPGLVNKAGQDVRAAAQATGKVAVLALLPAAAAATCPRSRM